MQATTVPMMAEQTRTDSGEELNTLQYVVFMCELCLSQLRSTQDHHLNPHPAILEQLLLQLQKLIRDVQTSGCFEDAKNRIFYPALNAYAVQVLTAELTPPLDLANFLILRYQEIVVQRQIHSLPRTFAAQLIAIRNAIQGGRCSHLTATYTRFYGLSCDQPPCPCVLPPLPSETTGHWGWTQWTLIQCIEVFNQLEPLSKHVPLLEQDEIDLHLAPSTRRKIDQIRESLRIVAWNLSNNTGRIEWLLRVVNDALVKLMFLQHVDPLVSYESVRKGLCDLRNFLLAPLSE